MLSSSARYAVQFGTMLTPFFLKIIIDLKAKKKPL